MAVGTATKEFMHERDYWAAGVSHLLIDFLNSGRNLVIAVLAVSLGLTNAQVGIALIIYNIGNAIAQPLFGMLADKIGPRRLVIGGIAWMILFSALTAIASDWIALLTLTAAGVGSGAFHPAGTLIATRSEFRERSRATALFFVMGMIGLFTGPLVAGIVIERWDRIGYLIMPAIAVVALVMSWQWIIDAPLQQAEKAHAPEESSRSGLSIPKIQLIPIVLVITLYSLIGIAIITFLPKLYIELNYDVDVAGLVVSVYLFGAAFGNYAGGSIADRLRDRRWVIFVGAVGAVAPAFFGLSATGSLQLILLFIAGLFASMPHSVIILLMQQILPNKRGMASGLALGGMFFSGSVASYFLGLVADSTSLLGALQGVVFLPLAVGILVWLLPKPNDPQAPS